jgi:hypothetical protein
LLLDLVLTFTITSSLFHTRIPFASLLFIHSTVTLCLLSSSSSSSLWGNSFHVPVLQYSLSFWCLYLLPSTVFILTTIWKNEH